MFSKSIIIFTIAISSISSGFFAPVNSYAYNYNQTVEVVNFVAVSHWLSKETDSVYVINFWATWCAPCVREIPYFEKINKEYRERGVKVLLVSLDFPSQVESRVVPFIEKLQVESEVILLNEPNPNRWIPLVSEEWSGAIPATIVYNRHRREFHEGELSFEELEAIIKPFLIDQQSTVSKP